MIDAPAGQCFSQNAVLEREPSVVPGSGQSSPRRFVAPNWTLEDTTQGVLSVDDAYRNWIIVISIGLVFGLILPPRAAVKWAAIVFGVLTISAAIYFIAEAGAMAMWLVVMVPLMAVLFAMGAGIGMLLRLLFSNFAR
ncbi:MAG: hypothetical protein U1F14_00515 [Steroidobacteraceae bacterium]